MAEDLIERYLESWWIWQLRRWVCGLAVLYWLYGPLTHLTHATWLPQPLLHWLRGPILVFVWVDCAIRFILWLSSEDGLTVESDGDEALRFAIGCGGVLVSLLIALHWQFCAAVFLIARGVWLIWGQHIWEQID